MKKGRFELLGSMLKRPFAWEAFHRIYVVLKSNAKNSVMREMMFNHLTVVAAEAAIIVSRVIEYKRGNYIQIQLVRNPLLLQQEL